MLKKRVHSNFQGGRASKNMGAGLVFNDYREYIPGDDFRAIDWKVYARTSKLFIKRYEEERNLNVHIIIDSSGSMNFGTPKKFDYAAMLGLGFSYIAMRNNEKFEISTFSNTLNIYKPKKGMRQLVSITDYLSNLQVKGNSNFYQSLRAYKKVINSKSVVIIISDFLYDIEQIRETLHHYKKNDLIIIQVLDNIEKNLEFEGEVLLTDAESDQKMRTYFSRRMRKHYKDKLYNHIYNVKDVCDELSAMFLSVTTNVPLFETFYHVVTKM
ncbi:MAG: DUF58 domain-containing protein [Nanoarchaeota archaeon]|nr:DUF58 domain-containing protein [Nanoarchaeota archaeon]